MYSYKTLAIIVLALSTAFPAFSAPIGEDQQQVGAISNDGDTNSDTLAPIFDHGLSLNLEKRASAIDKLLKREPFKGLNDKVSMPARGLSDLGYKYNGREFPQEFSGGLTDLEVDLTRFDDMIRLD